MRCRKPGVHGNLRTRGLWIARFAADVTNRYTCYSMSMSLDHRLQILIDDERHRRISAVAQERGVSVATIVREAIDRGLASPDTRRRAAGQRLLHAPDMAVPEPAELHAELDSLRARRA
jgi:hypothetical protein